MNNYDFLFSNFQDILIVLSLINIVTIIIFKTNFLYLFPSLFFIYGIIILAIIISQTKYDWLENLYFIIIPAFLGIFFMLISKWRITITREF